MFVFFIKNCPYADNSIFLNDSCLLVIQKIKKYFNWQVFHLNSSVVGGFVVHKVIRLLSLCSLFLITLPYQNCGVTNFEFVADTENKIDFDESSSSLSQELLAKNGYRPGPIRVADFECRLMASQLTQSADHYLTNFLSFDRRNPFASYGNLKATIYFYDSSQGGGVASIGYQDLIPTNSLESGQNYQLINQKQVSVKLSGKLVQPLSYYVEIKDQKDQIVCATQEVKIQPLVPQCSLQIQGSNRLYKDQSLLTKINHNLAIQSRASWQVEYRISRLIPPSTPGGSSNYLLESYNKVAFTSDLREITPAADGTYRLEYSIFSDSAATVPICSTNSVSFLKFDDQASPPVYGPINNSSGSGESNGGGSTGGSGNSVAIRSYECNDQVIVRNCTVNVTKCIGSKPLQSRGVVVENRQINFILPGTLGRTSYVAQNGDINPQNSRYTYTNSAPAAFYICDGNNRRFIKQNDSPNCELNIDEYDPKSCDGSGLNMGGN